MKWEGERRGGLEPICQLFKAAVRKVNKEPILSVTEDGRFREHETLSEVHPVLII